MHSLQLRHMCGRSRVLGERGVGQRVHGHKILHDAAGRLGQSLGRVSKAFASASIDFKVATTSRK